MGTACGDPGSGLCDSADTCDGGGACLVNNEPMATQCNASAGDCDVAEFCDGAGSCPVDAFQIVGTACGDPGSGLCDSI